MTFSSASSNSVVAERSGLGHVAIFQSIRKHNETDPSSMHPIAKVEPIQKFSQSGSGEMKGTMHRDQRSAKDSGMVIRQP
jgi:hypothetical protein